MCIHDAAITAVAPGTTLEYVASAFNGWQAVKIGSQVGWVSGAYSDMNVGGKFPPPSIPIGIGGSQRMMGFLSVVEIYKDCL